MVQIEVFENISRVVVICVDRRRGRMIGTNMSMSLGIKGSHLVVFYVQRL